MPGGLHHPPPPSHPSDATCGPSPALASAAAARQPTARYAPVPLVYNRRPLSGSTPPVPVSSAPGGPDRHVAGSGGATGSDVALVSSPGSSAPSSSAPAASPASVSVGSATTDPVDQQQFPAAGSSVVVTTSAAPHTRLRDGTIPRTNYKTSNSTAQGHLHPLYGTTRTVRASLYADDDAIFVKPIKEGVQLLAATLASFGEVAGLVNNCAKSLVDPIRCDGIDLENVLHAFPESVHRFRCVILDFKRVHFQHLEDKITDKLPHSQGRHVASAGRTVHVEDVLMSIAIYLLTPRDILLEVLKKIDSIHRAYLWAGTDKVSEGKYKVNWDLVCKPNNKGGLGC
ncbi:hypothetical protein D1007_54030 [Hordeum vulgare]|nr:hypothetical protein D1007_54030 [Hordeum vulgare]